MHDFYVGLHTGKQNTFILHDSRALGRSIYSIYVVLRFVSQHLFNQEVSSFHEFEVSALYLFPA